MKKILGASFALLLVMPSLQVDAQQFGDSDNPPINMPESFDPGVRRDAQIRLDILNRNKILKSLEELRINLTSQDQTIIKLKKDITNLRFLISESEKNGYNVDSLNAIFGKYNIIWNQLSKLMNSQDQYFATSFQTEQSVSLYRPTLISPSHIQNSFRRFQMIRQNMLNNLTDARVDVPEEYAHAISIESFHDQIFENIELLVQKLNDLKNNLTPDRKSRSRDYLHHLLKYTLVDIENAQNIRAELNKRIFSLESQALSNYDDILVSRLARSAESNVKDAITDKSSSPSMSLHSQLLQLNQSLLPLLSQIISKPIQETTPPKFNSQTERPNVMSQSPPKMLDLFGPGPGGVFSKEKK